MSDVATPLAVRIDSAIFGNPHLAGQTVRIEMRPGRVVLRGVVPSFYQKQIAQEVVRAIEGVERVENRLDVDWPEPAIVGASGIACQRR